MARDHETIKLTRAMLSQSRVIARGRGIRDVQRLVRTYGGTVSGWTKKSSPMMLFGRRRIEVHWYEHHGVGRFEQKLMRISES